MKINLRREEVTTRLYFDIIMQLINITLSTDFNDNKKMNIIQRYPLQKFFYLYCRLFIEDKQ